MDQQIRTFPRPLRPPGYWQLSSISWHYLPPQLKVIFVHLGFSLSCYLFSSNSQWFLIVCSYRWMKNTVSGASWSTLPRLSITSVSVHRPLWTKTLRARGLGAGRLTPPSTTLHRAPSRLQYGAFQWRCIPTFWALIPSWLCSLWPLECSPLVLA